jgi:hypothetical protein
MKPNPRKVLLASTVLPLVVAAALAAAPAPPASATSRGIDTPMTTAQRKCANANYKALRLLGKALGRIADACLSLQAREVSVEECLANAAGFADRFQAKATKLVDTACSGVDRDGIDKAPAFGTASTPPDVADIVGAAGLAQFLAISTSFGEIETIDDRILSLPTEELVAGALCQASVQRSQTRCAAQVLLDFASCAKLGLQGNDNSGLAPFANATELSACLGADLKGRIARFCDPANGKLTAVYDKFCAGPGVDTSVVLPECDGAVGGIEVCLAEASACTACLAAATTAGLDPGGCDSLCD